MICSQCLGLGRGSLSTVDLPPDNTATSTIEREHNRILAEGRLDVDIIGGFWGCRVYERFNTIDLKGVGVRVPASQLSGNSLACDGESLRRCCAGLLPLDTVTH